MALKISLKPNEKIVVNGAVIANGDRPTRLHFLNKARFLREKDIMQEEEITREEDYLYFLIQLLYVDVDNQQQYLEQIDFLAAKLAENHPDKAKELGRIAAMAESGKIFEALKESRKVFPLQPRSESNNDEDSDPSAVNNANIARDLS